MMTMTNKQLLQLINEGRVYWTNREGGSQTYQDNRTQISEMVQRKLARVVRTGCCSRRYELTQAGRNFINEKVDA
jgi:hypothetical protein